MNYELIRNELGVSYKVNYDLIKNELRFNLK